MSSITTPEFWNLIRTEQPPHRNMVFQVVEYEYYINLRFFLDNFSEFSPAQQQDLTEWIEKMIHKIQAMGIPCGIEALETKGGNKI